MLEGSVDVQSWKERTMERGRKLADGMLVPARAVCVVANTVPQHDLLHKWQKVSVKILKLKGRK